MEIKQLKELVTKAVAQTTGAKLADLATSTLVDMGKDVLNSGGVEVFTKSLIDQVGKIVIESKKYTKGLPDFFIESWEWGGYLERVYTDLLDYEVNNSWDLTDKKQYPAHIFYKPNVQAKIFDELKTVETRVSFPEDYVIKTAFTDWSTMNTFVSGIQMSVENTIEVALEGIGEMLIGSAIAISDNATNTAVHLLRDFNTATGQNIASAEDALNNIEFLRYAVRQIHLYRQRLTRMTKLFNNGNVNVWSRDENQKLVALSDFISAIDTVLLANTYHDGKLSIGDYFEIPYWQSPVGETSKFTLADNSAISISADAGNKLGIGTEKYDSKNAIALLYDYRAIGATMRNKRVSSEYTASGEFWTYYHKLDGNYIIDANFPLVAFFID